jgi:hypothetical protein
MALTAKRESLTRCENRIYSGDLSEKNQQVSMRKEWAVRSIFVN